LPRHILWHAAGRHLLEDRRFDARETLKLFWFASYELLLSRAS
jgi:hypothetical protein